MLHAKWMKIHMYTHTHTWRDNIRNLKPPNPFCRCFTLFSWSTLTEHAVSQAAKLCAAPLCELIFSSLQSPAENLHYHQVVFLKRNLMVVVREGKRVCNSLVIPHRDTSCQVPALQPLLTNLPLWCGVLGWYAPPVTDSWHLIHSVTHIKRVICKYYLPIVFCRRRETMERRERRDLHLNGNTFRSRCD